jgi:hypothetical protein
MNTYAERLRKGDSGLLEPASVLGAVPGKRARGRGVVRQSFRESSSSLSDEEDSSSEASADEDAPNGKEDNREGSSVSEPAVDKQKLSMGGAEKAVLVTPELPPKERRAIRQTKHDYSRL